MKRRSAWSLLENLRRITEAKCPGCGHDGAYIGLNSVECSNPSCKFFDKKMGGDQPKSKTPPEWRKKVEDGATRYLGPKWKEAIDKHQGWQGAADWLIDQLYKRNWNEGDAAGEIGFFYELAKDGTPVNAGHYKHAQIVKGKVTLKPGYDMDTGDERPDRY